MAPVLSEPDKHPESPAEHGAAPPPPLRRHLHALLKSNLKNLLADCCGSVDVCAAGRLHDFSPPAFGAMKNVLGDHCKPTNGIMDSEKLKKQDVMGLHSANSSNLQELLNNKKQFASSLVASSPTPELADMIHEFETLAESAPITSGNGHVPPEEMQMITQLVTSMDENPPVTAAVVAPPPPPVPAAPPTAAPPPLTTVEATRTQQTQLVGRSARLLRRLRSLQARTARRQTTAQTSALLERLSAAHAAPAAAAAAATPAAPSACTAPSTSSLTSPVAAGADTAAAATGDITEMLRSPKVKHFSTTQLVNLVLNNKSATAAAAAVVTSGPPPPPPAPSESLPCSVRAEREVAAAVARPAGVALRQLERLAAAADSDATESSSGGESGDEFEPGWDDEAMERAAPIRKRALWRWATERSSLACRWSWVAAQVTDLEFRIRQLRQLHRQLRAARPVAAPAPAPAPAAAQELGGAGDACSGVAPLEHHKASEAADTGTGDGQCARTRLRAALGRRRLFSVCRAARRAAGGAPARCRCDPGVDLCTTCGGRPDAGVRVRPDIQPVRERRALLAAGHHPVLSLPTEAPLSLGYDALLRSPRWQQNHLHARPRGPRLFTTESSGTTAAGAGTGVGAASAGIPSATGSTQPVPATPSSRPSFHRRKSVLKRLYEADGGGAGEPTLGGSNGRRVGRPPKRTRSASVCDARPAAGAGPSPLVGDDDPSWTPGRQSPERRESRERSAAALRAARQHRQNSYDIDNIVIPASMASTTKIEKPKYKEIVTPGWRPVDVRPAAANGEPASAVSPEPPEPLEEGVFERRHLPAELEERRRLYQTAGKPPGGATAGGGGGGGGTGHGRGRPRAHTPDTPRAADAGADPDRPRILRYKYLLEPCGFPLRRFPLSDRLWKELLASENSDGSLIQGWRSPRSRSAADPAAEDQRSTK